MKILYIASERNRAQVATRALRTISPNVTVLWGPNFERAAFAVLENPDLAALIVEVQSDSQGCSYLKQMGTLGVQAPVVMVLPENTASPTESLKAGARDYVAKGLSFSQELPAVVNRAIGGGQASPVMRADHARSETVAASAVSVPVERRAQRVTQPTETERRVGDRETPVRQREQRRAVEQSAEAGSDAKLEAQLHQERQVRAGLEQKLADAQAALQNAEQLHRSATTAAAAVLADRRREYETGIARTAAMQETLEEQLRQSRQSHASAVTDLERLTRRNAELTSMLTEATASGAALAGRVTDLETALAAANDRASRDQTGAAEHAAERQAQLEEEIEKRRNVEEELARVKRALDNVGKPHSSVAAVASALLAKRQAQFDAELAEAVEARNTFDREAREREAALDGARQTLQAHAADVERLTQREAELTSQLAEAAAIRSTLERQLADATDALKDATDSASRNRLTAATKAAERELEFEGVIRHERATRADVEQRLADVETALRAAEQQHASAMTAAATERAEGQTQFEIELSQMAATRDEFKRRVSDVETALAAAQRDHAATVTRLERLTQRETELSSRLAEAAAIRSTLEQQLGDAVDAAKAADEGARRDRLDAEAKAAEREVEIKRLIDREHAMRADVEQRLGQVETTLREAEQQHSSAMTAAVTERADRQAQFETELSQIAATRDEFKHRFSDADAALAVARRDHAAAAAEVDRRTQREAELTSQLREAAAMRSTLERQLTDAATALKDAEEGARRDRVAAETRAAERDVEFERLISHERTTRADVEQQRAKVEAALHEAERKHTLAMTAAATEQAECQTQFEIELSQLAATRDELRRRVTDADTALAAAQRDHAAALTRIERLTQREAALTSQLAEASTLQSTLERQLTDAATERAECQAQFDAQLAEAAEAHNTLSGEARELTAALDEARQTIQARAIDVERLTRSEAELTSQLADAATMRSTLERQLTNAATTLKDAEESARRDRVAAEKKAAERDVEFERLIGHERTTRADVEQRLAQVEEALHEGELKHTLAMRAAATERAERQAQFDAQLAEAADARNTLTHESRQLKAALDRAQQTIHAHAIDVEHLTQREAELTSRLTEAAAMRSTLERQLTDAATALKDADEGARRDRLAAETRAAERDVEFERLIGHERTRRAEVEQRLAQEIARRDGLDRTIVEMRAAAADAEQRFHDDIATVTARGRDEVAHLQKEFANERQVHNERQAELLNEIQNLNAARDAAHESLATIREQSRRREIDFQNERDGLDRARSTAETEGRRVAAELTETTHNLEKARREFQQTLDRVTGEHADALAKLVVEGAERDARIEGLEKQLDESRRELRRQFQHAPLALWRCARDGALTDANRALAHMVGYRESDELRGADFVNTVFESTDDLSWLIERCLSTKARQSVETAWKQRNGERLVVRLSAVEFAPDIIEIAVEDVTNACVLEDRLAQAHRMEAVARLASEIALTCGRLLRDVHEDGQQWLMGVSDDTAIRKRGDRLLGEVARAASYLERLTAHGDEQTSALKPVELNRVLRDLKPVLKHVAGDDVELELSKTSSALNVDMKADRVERLLVNLASYGRERMPGGGRLRIELDTVVVDQKFIADHPNVRRGHHALITVTAIRREMAGAGTLQIHATEPSSNNVVSERPGVDLGALQELLQECGGHLWLTVEPPGNMVVKLRLPLRVWDDRPQPTTSDALTSRKRGIADAPTGHKRAMSRWFRH